MAPYQGRTRDAERGGVPYVREVNEGSETIGFRTSALPKGLLWGTWERGEEKEGAEQNRT